MTGLVRDGGLAIAPENEKEAKAAHENIRQKRIRELQYLVKLYATGKVRVRACVRGWTSASFVRRNEQDGNSDRQERASQLVYKM